MVKVGSYENIVRRKIIDINGKIVHREDEIPLNITKAAKEPLNFRKLWYLANKCFASIEIGIWIRNQNLMKNLKPKVCLNLQEIHYFTS